VVAKRQRLLEELDKCSHALRKAQVAVDEFVTDNAAIIEQIRARASTGVQAVIDDYTTRMNDFLATKREKYKERDDYRRKLGALRKNLQVRYSAAEGIFLPIFTALAGSFLGIDLDVRFVTTPSTGVGLVLDMRGSSRRQYHQLSESQRFFIDIALRMALAQFMSSPEGPASLYIDTPEGSLDVAYETRAGQMFSQFARNGHGIVMTANINGSRLLTAMAEQCGPRRMHVQRMTTWTELSDVQQKEERLFQEVFAAIEKALRKGGKRVQG
jgi:DNA repair exonuclease SbcCD ATPase subunit